MKKITFIVMFALASSVIAGGDDRDKGPVESLDSIAPVVDQKIIDAKKARDMVLTDTSKKIIGHTDSGVPVTNEAHESCKNRLSLSDYNINVFKSALVSGVLYNTGPIDGIGTAFAPSRWAEYFTCVEELDK